MNTQPNSNFREASSDAEPLLWSTADLANYLRCSERQILTLRRRGLPAIHIGGLIRFDPQAAREWLTKEATSHGSSPAPVSTAADGPDGNPDSGTLP